MRAIGRPLFPSAISKIENGHRRVDADELVALAVALDCTPNRLLIAPQAGDEEIQLTEGSTELPIGGRVQTEPSTRDAWRWARGTEPLHPGASVQHTDDFEADLHQTFANQDERRRRFQRENRPDDVPDHTDYSALPVELRAALDSVIEAALQPLVDAYERGLPWKTVLRHLELRFDQVMWKKLRLDEVSEPLTRDEYKRISTEILEKARGEEKRE